MRSGGPTRAVVLAAGLGTRLLPLTRDIPKPLLPVWGVPPVEHTLAMLRRWGVRDVLVNLHHRADRLLDHFRGRADDGLRVQLSFEPVVLGTGGVLRRAEWFLRGGGPFWMVNADVLAAVDPGPIVAAFAPGVTMASCWLHPARGPRTVEMADGVISSFRSATPGGAGTYTFCGVQVIDPAILDPTAGFLPADERPVSIIGAYERAQAAGYRIAGVSVPGSYWADIGTPAQMLAAHRELHEATESEGPGAGLVSASMRRRVTALRRAGFLVAGFAAVSDGVTIGRGATLTDVVLGPGVWVVPGASARNLVAGAGTVVRGVCTGVAMPAAAGLTEDECAVVRAAGVDVDGATMLPFGPRGSERTFARVRDARRDVMLVSYVPTRRENVLYAGHARFLRAAGVPAPEILAEDRERNLLVLEDLGDRSLQEVIRGASPTAVERAYRRVLNVALALHGRASAMAHRKRLRMVPGFRPTLYRWEREYFAEHMLAGRCRLAAEEIARIRAELEAVGARLNRAPRVIVHRDLQSTNVMWPRRGPVLIDFQGMRWGPAVYDLASLLLDPYVELDVAIVERLVAAYARRAPEARAGELFWLAGIQRLAQALGAFARLGSQAGTRGFADHIPAALRRMALALERTPGLPALADWCRGQMER